MKPEKAKRAIIITLIIAVLAIAVCGFFLYRLYKPVPSGDVVSEETAELAEPEETIQEEASAPSHEDLAGCSDKLQYPKNSSYLKAYETATVRPQTGDTAVMLVRPQKQEWEADVISRLNRGQTVTVIARENGYSLVKISEGIAGWVITTDLAS